MQWDHVEEFQKSGQLLVSQIEMGLDTEVSAVLELKEQGMARDVTSDHASSMNL